MYAIIADGGRQYKVEEGQEVEVDYREVPPGEQLTFDKVLAVSAEDGLKLGQPNVAGATVTAEVVGPNGTESIEFDAALVSTGSRPRIPEWCEPDGDRILTTRDCYPPKIFPESITVIGSGVTGVYYHTGGRRAYPEMLELALRMTYPNVEVTVVNAGLSGNKTDDGLNRLQKDVLDLKPDLVTVMFVTRRALSPLHFFGRIAFVLFALGLAPQVYFFVRWLGGAGLHVRPIMLAGFVMIIVSLQIASIGLVAEIMNSWLTNVGILKWYVLKGGGK